MHVMPVFERLRQEKRKFKDILSFIEKFQIKSKQQTKQPQQTLREVDISIEMSIGKNFPIGKMICERWLKDETTFQEHSSWLQELLRQQHEEFLCGKGIFNLPKQIHQGKIFIWRTFRLYFCENSNLCYFSPQKLCLPLFSVAVLSVGPHLGGTLVLHI